MPTSVLLTAACRAVGIPAGLGFGDVRNHLQSEKLLATMGTDLFAWRDRGVYVDVPFAEITATFAEVYPRMNAADGGSVPDDRDDRFA